MNVEIIVVASRPRGDDRSSVVILGDRRGYSDFAQLRTVIGKPFAKRIQAEVHPVRRPGLFFQNDAILFAPRLVGSIQRFAQKAIWAVVPDAAIADQLNLIHQRNAEQSWIFRQSHACVRIFPRENAACEIHHVLPYFRIKLGENFRLKRRNSRVFFREPLPAPGVKIECDIKTGLFEFGDLAEKTVELRLIEHDTRAGLDEFDVKMMQPKCIHAVLFQAPGIILNQILREQSPLETGIGSVEPDRLAGSILKFKMAVANDNLAIGSSGNRRGQRTEV